MCADQVLGTNGAASAAAAVGTGATTAALLPIKYDRCAPSAVRTTVGVATQTDYLMVTAVEGPSWIRFENPTTGRKLWINNLTGESFYKDDPTPWKCWHCGTSGQRYWVKMSEGADWETLPAFWE